jgi:hypothetical protein
MPSHWVQSLSKSSLPAKTQAAPAKVYLSQKPTRFVVPELPENNLKTWMIHLI